MEDFFDNEIGRKILALIKASFKVSDLIPDLVFREKIKHQILEVYKTFLIDSGNQSFSALLKEIDILEHYFYLGGHLNLVKEGHLKQLQNGFLVFKSHIVLLNNINDENKNLLIPRIEESAPQLRGGGRILGINKYKHASDPTENLTAKQKKILEKFENKNTLKLAEILELFPDISEKTVRNELNFLIKLGKITRGGWGNGSFYKKTIDSENQ